MSVTTLPIQLLPLCRSCIRTFATRCAFSQWHSSQHQSYRRALQSSATSAPRKIPDFAFAFDIDGVLVRSSSPLPHATKALRYLQSQRIPFILLTNGGGKTEAARIANLNQELDVKLDTSMFVQSHTPFAGMEEWKDKCVLVCGGDGDGVREVAESYGFRDVVTPGDIYAANPEVWTFSKNFHSYYKTFAKPLPKPLYSPDTHPDLSSSLKIDAVFIYSDPRDWGLDATILLDLLQSKDGVYGTLSDKNGNADLPNRGWQQDGQPPLFFSNPDLWWAAKYHLSRLGQGGFREALEGLWAAVTGGRNMDVKLHKTVIGKPFELTYKFAERRLVEHRNDIFKDQGDEVGQLKTVYMVGDNPESDIRGANTYRSDLGTDWHSILVKTGVWQEYTEPTWMPRDRVQGVWDAVKLAVQREGWDRPEK